MAGIKYTSQIEMHVPPTEKNHVVRKSDLDGVTPSIVGGNWHIGGTDTGVTATNTSESAENSGDNFQIYVTKYADGFISGYGWVRNAGNTDGVQITLPDGYSFRDTLYGLSGMSLDADEGGAIDGIKGTKRTLTSFALITSHIDEGLAFEYSDEQFSFIVLGHWK